MPFPIIAIGFCSLCGYICKKAHDIYQENQQTKRSKHELKSKQLEKVAEDSKRAQGEINRLNDKLTKVENEVKEREKEITNIQNDLKDPNISDEKKTELEEKLVALLASQEDSKKEKDRIIKTIKDLENRIKKNNDIIANAGSNPNDNHWIWQFMTMENIMIMGACYAMYTLLKDDKK